MKFDTIVLTVAIIILFIMAVLMGQALRGVFETFTLL